MKDTPGTRIETELDRIRREAFEKEARALKEAALQYFKEQTSAELTGLRSALKDEMKTAVTAAMSDEAVKKALSKELTEQVLGKVAADIAKQIGDRIEKEVGQAETRVVEKVRKDLLESWTKAAKKALNEGVDKARTELSLMSFLKPKAKSKKPQEEVADQLSEETAVAEDFSQVPLTKPEETSRWRNLLSSEEAIAAICIGAFIVIALIIWLILRPPTSERDTLADTPPPAVTQTETPAPRNEPSVTTERTRTDWMKVVTDAEDQLSPDSPLRGLYTEHPPSDQFACWFSDDAQKRLEKLARASSSDDLQSQLEETFEPCFTRKPKLRDPMYAVFSAQATVAKTFVQYRNEWETWCASAYETPPPSLALDGDPGTNTWDGINLFLKCTGHSGELTIKADSTTPQYLYVTYLALRELQR